MESVKKLLEQMLDQVQHQRTGEPNDVYEIIGKLEQVKAYLLTEAMHVTIFSGLSSFQSTLPLQSSPPIAGQQALVSNQQTTPPIAGQQALVSNQQIMPQAVDIVSPMNMAQQTQMVVQNQASIPQPAGPFVRNPGLWQVVDEDLFEAVGQPVLWFSKLVDSEYSQNRITIHSDNKEDFIKRSPPFSYAHCSLFAGMTLPITLYSRKLETMFGGAPGLLHNKSKKQMHMYWPSVGILFTEPTMVDVWFQWKKLDPRYMLIVNVEEQDLSRLAGPSGAGAGPSGAGAGPSGASKRPKLGGV